MCHTLAQFREFVKLEFAFTESKGGVVVAAAKPCYHDTPLLKTALNPRTYAA